MYSYHPQDIFLILNSMAVLCSALCMAWLCHFTSVVNLFITDEVWCDCRNLLLYSWDFFHCPSASQACTWDERETSSMVESCIQRRLRATSCSSIKHTSIFSRGGLSLLMFYWYLWSFVIRRREACATWREGDCSIKLISCRD